MCVLQKPESYQVGIFFPLLLGTLVYFPYITEKKPQKIKITATTKPTQNPIRLPLEIKAARTVTAVFNPQPASNRFSPSLLVLLELIPFSWQNGYPLLKKHFCLL